MRAIQTLCAVVICVVLVQESSSARQGCATTNVNIRTGPSTRYTKIGLLRTGRCVPYKGSRGNWALVTYNRRNAWIYKTYLRISTTTTPSPPPTTGGSTCPAIVTRREWGARSPKRRTRMRSVPSNIYIHHATGPTCYTSSTCRSRVRGYQNYHMNTRGWSDIGYSFLIGQDGKVYEGRGWMMVGGHTYGHNSDGYGICFIGDFTNSVPNSAAQAAYRSLVRCGVSRGYLRSNYRVRGHRDVGSTSCPGNTLYREIKGWTNYRA